ncbi:MAG: sigma-54 dependent transcriptional regulator [Corticimicrobacter sp.]|uniref:sigma-54 dependent transcriptional regulator n=1 Tax=Corticimicrobacter sp. TaxID=2678536 RepID=UPI0032DA1543
MTSTLPTWPIPTPEPPPEAPGWLFEDPASRALHEIIEQIAPSDAGVLIEGDSGTEKELVARHIHTTSLRRAYPFVAVNCGAFSESLVDAELYGHENGAFAGAFGSQPGWLETAHRGTLFLDEIEALPLQAQAKLIRTLQEGTVSRLGSRQRLPADVRILAATHDDLAQRVQQGLFRKDLYYHVNVVSLAMLPLQSRPGDILPLARHFIRQYCKRLHYAPVELSAGAERRLLAHPWPGHVRELENVIYRTLLLSRGLRIQADDLRLPAASDTPATPPVSPVSSPDIKATYRAQEKPDAEISLARDTATFPGNDIDPAGSPISLEQVLEQLCQTCPHDLEQRVLDTLLLKAWHHNHYSQVQTAQQLGISRHVVRARLVRLQQLAPGRNRLTDTGPDAPPPSSST